MKQLVRNITNRLFGFSHIFIFILVLAGAPALMAYPLQPLSITSVTAVATLEVTSMEQSTCEGEGGEIFVIIKVKGEGPIVSSDPRLEGTFFADAVILENLQGVGISRDNFEIRDPVTGRLKAKGRAKAVDAQPNPIKGHAVARLRDGSRLHAQSAVFLPAPGTTDPLIITYGASQGSGDPQDHAVIISGRCGGLFWGR